MPEERIVLESAEEQYLKTEKELRIREFWTRILEEMAEENESWYNIITLIYCLGKTHEEVAEELDMTMQVLYSKFYRARRWIRKNYENEFLEIVGGERE
jgi:RNA polymerase sigma-70 factor (ECF subfamily)